MGIDKPPSVYYNSIKKLRELDLIRLRKLKPIQLNLLNLEGQMSTQNKNKSYMEIVMDKYMTYLSAQNAKEKEELEASLQLLVTKIAEDKISLAKYNKVIELQKQIAKIKVFSKEQLDEIAVKLAETQAKLDTFSQELVELNAIDVSQFDEKQLEKHNKACESKKKSIEIREKAIKTLQEKLDSDAKKVEAKKELEDQIAKTVATIEIEKTEDEEEKEVNFEELKKALVVEIALDERSIKEIKARLQKLSGDPKPSLDTFTSFLESKNLSTAHAEEIFNHLTKGENLTTISKDEFSMRKMHPTRDYIIKKVVVPTAITSTAIGASIGAILSSGLVGGSTVLGFIPVSGTPGLTEMATTITGAAIGLAATPTIIKTKNLITRAYYRNKSQSAAKNIEDYNDGTDIANIRASKLINKIQETQHAILSSNNPLNLIRRVINRNRLHQIVDYTIDLYKIYHEVESDQSVDVKLKAETLKPIYEMLTNVENFMLNDISEEIVYSMLHCKENKKDHSHKYMFENVDIYARLKITLDRISKVNAEQSDMAQQLKNAKKTTKNIEQKKEEAYKLIYAEKPITGILNFEKQYGQYVEIETQDPEVKPEPEKKPSFTAKPEAKVIVSSLSEDGSVLTLELEDGKSIKVPSSKLESGAKIVSAKEGKTKISVTYVDGTKQEILKINQEIEAARSVLNALLHDEEHIKELKANGYKAQTINSLKEKLTIWINTPTQKLCLSGKVKELYNFEIETMSNKAKNEVAGI